MKRKHERVRIRANANPFFFITGKKNGGWYAVLNWNYGSSTIAISWNDVRRLISSRRGDFVIARRLEATELAMLREYEESGSHELYARLYFKEFMKWRAPRKW